MFRPSPTKVIMPVRFANHASMLVGRTRWSASVWTERMRARLPMALAHGMSVLE